MIGKRANGMSKPIVLTAGDPLLNTAHFRPYRSIVERRVVPFTPGPDQKQTMEIVTPWGETLTARAGDLLVSEVKNPNDYWPVRADIFDETYIIIRPGYCIKRGLVHLAPLVEFTDGDEEAEVTVYSLEGPITVRAGDFYLARGVKGEIWVVPKSKVEEIMVPADE